MVSSAPPRADFDQSNTEALIYVPRQAFPDLAPSLMLLTDKGLRPSRS
jgi:hypothetical protein